MIRRPPRSTLSSSSAASDVYKRQVSTQSTGAAERHLTREQPHLACVAIDQRSGQIMDEAPAVLTINRKALLQSVRQASERDSDNSASDNSIVLTDGSESEYSEEDDGQQTITFKAEHLQRAQSKQREDKRADQRSDTQDGPVYLEDASVPAPMVKVTRERTDNSRHALRKTVQSVAADNYSSDEFGDEGSDDDFRTSRPTKRKRKAPAAKKAPAASPQKAAAPAAPRAPVAMSAGAVIMQRAGLFKPQLASKAKPGKKGASTVRSRLSSKLFGKR
eukprot:TRINITY_DN18120_c0_g1_i1.p1 TRINITY_DN18120_c0_g1~~TRINITY_DN18120_c0_g1_i1.p1  ORF type:complete len:276 (-),score=67.94 TRINITY_DN18120_c0_g1_i1:290-1117(-)